MNEIPEPRRDHWGAPRSKTISWYDRCAGSALAAGAASIERGS